MNMFNKFEGKHSRKNGLFKVFNNASDDTTIINLYGPVFENPPKADEHEGDYIALSEVRKEIEEIDSSKILIKINTTGGSFWAGTSIANLLREHSAEVTTRVVGVAASAGSIIFTAGKNREIFSNSSILLHYVRSVVYGTAKELEKAAADVRELDKSLIENYKEIFNGTEKELRDILESDKFMTAAKAKELGFCTKIIEGQGKDDSEIENKINSFFGNSAGSESKQNDYRQAILSDRPRKNEKLINELMRKYDGKKKKNLFQKNN